MTIIEQVLQNMGITAEEYEALLQGQGHDIAKGIASGLLPRNERTELAEKIVNLLKNDSNPPS